MAVPAAAWNLCVRFVFPGAPMGSTKGCDAAIKVMPFVEEGALPSMVQ